MADVRWAPSQSIQVFDASQPLIQILQEAQDPDWIVLVRPNEPGGPYWYAYRTSELHAFASRRSDVLTRPAVDALALHEYMGSPVAPPGQRPAAVAPPPQRVWQPSMLRIVALAASGHPVAVGEIDPTGDAVTFDSFMEQFRPPTTGAAPPPPAPPPSAPAPPVPPVDLGPPRGTGSTRRQTRGRRRLGTAPQTPPVPQAPPRPASRNGGEHPLAGSPPPSPTTPPQTVHAVLSAEAPAEIALNEEAIVDVRVELAGEAAAPLAHHIASAVQPAEKITAILSVDAARLKIVGPRKLDLDPPAEGQPSQNAFVVVGLQAGDARILVMFRQGGSDLGTVSFRTTVAQTVASSVPAASGHAEAQPRVPSDDDVLVLLIDEDREGSQVFFRYHAHSPALGWNYKEFRSDVFKAPRSGAGTAALRYVRAIYQQILDRVLLNSEDLQLFQTELRALGADMCRQLLDDDFVREVWTLRSQVSAVQVTTDEPYVPWELLRLQHPDTREIDDKFLSEYGLVRSLKGRSAPRTLHARDWRYLVGTYPFGSQAALGREVEYLTGTLPTRGITPQRIESGATPLIAALQNPDFDVLHIACHGDTDLKDVERTTLILTDRRTQRGIEPVTVVPATIQAEARLDARKPRLPLVFLNACETGQQAPSLTDWGGWPRAFWEAGAAAFVGTSWSVYEKPAATFAGAFYDSLLAGSTLAQAAAAGRAAAKALGDGSWLAYTVYGNPVARLAT